MQESKKEIYKVAHESSLAFMKTSGIQPVQVKHLGANPPVFSCLVALATFALQITYGSLFFLTS